jgi:hypothetical protein
MRVAEKLDWKGLIQSLCLLEERPVPALMYTAHELHYGKLMPYSRGVEKLRVAHLMSIFHAVYGT